MRSDIDTLKLTDLEKEFIEDYFRYIRTKINSPTHPEISIGSARYPLGRLRIRPSLTEKFLNIRYGWIEQRSNEKIKASYGKYLDGFQNVLNLYKKVRDRGKTVKKYKRK